MMPTAKGGLLRRATMPTRKTPNISSDKTTEIMGVGLV
jgi:hypothetical protein